MKKEMPFETLPEKIARNLVRLRGGQSQLALSVKTGVDLRSINRWESGKSMPSQRNLNKLAEALGCHQEEFLK